MCLPALDPDASTLACLSWAQYVRREIKARRALCLSSPRAQLSSNAGFDILDFQGQGPSGRIRVPKSCLLLSKTMPFGLVKPSHPLGIQDACQVFSAALASWWSGSKNELARHLEPDKQPAYLASGEPNYGESLKEYLGPGVGDES